MNREELSRIRLKVVTNAGINILCTALRTWKVAEWLPYIEQAYREVKEDQQDDQGSKQRFIKAIRIKKEDFYVANSEYIGDIFEDNDEVQCEISFPQINKNQKKEKKDKAHKKKEGHRQTEEIPIVNQSKGLKRQIIDAVEEDIEPKPKKRVKIDKSQKKQSEKKEIQQQTPVQKIKQIKENQQRNKESESKNKNHKSLQEKQQKKHKQQQIMKNLDLAKLKSRIKIPVQGSVVHPLTGKILKVQPANNDSSSEESS